MLTRGSRMKRRLTAVGVCFVFTLLTAACSSDGADDDALTVAGDTAGSLLTGSGEDLATSSLAASSAGEVTSSQLPAGEALSAPASDGAEGSDEAQAVPVDGENGVAPAAGGTVGLPTPSSSALPGAAGIPAPGAGGTPTPGAGAAPAPGAVPAPDASGGGGDSGGGGTPSPAGPDRLDLTPGEPRPVTPISADR